jgi:hypothetical protein
MKYQKPQLHALDTAAQASGGCANGSAATFLSDCGIGQNHGGGIFGHYCINGAGPRAWCLPGAAAGEAGVNWCSAGIGPATTCGAGGAPA